MNHSKLLRRLVGGISVVASVAIITFTGCTKVDNSLGSDLTLENQGMKLDQRKFSGLTPSGKNYFESKLYKTDSISTTNLESGYFGVLENDTFGMRTAGFYTQYIAANKLNDDIFGYKPIFDSAVLYVAIDSYGGDTSVVQQFEVFEVLNDEFLTESKDTTFFPNFDIEPELAAEPVFTFTFPDAENGVYTSASYIKMENTALTQDFIDRLMLEKKDVEYDQKIYEDDEEWVKYFKGLYIRPAASSNTDAAIFATTMTSSGFGFYGRSREESDPGLIKDTIGMTYLFRSDYAKAGNVSINTIGYNYDNSLINLDDVMTPEKKKDDVEVPSTSVLRVEGMGGVVSQITLSEEFFEELDTILDTEKTESGDNFTSLFFNQAKLRIYMTQVTSYDPALIDPFVVTPWLDYMPTSLGLYTDYSKYNVVNDGATYTTLTGIADYAYSYESSYTLDYGGEMNRSWGCYVMNVSSYIQSVWNGYLVAKKEAEESGKEIDWDSIKGRTIYLAPKAKELNTFKYASVQAGDGSANSAPMELELTYTMIR